MPLRLIMSLCKGILRLLGSDQYLSIYQGPTLINKDHHVTGIYLLAGTPTVVSLVVCCMPVNIESMSPLFLLVYMMSFRIMFVLYISHIMKLFFFGVFDSATLAFAYSHLFLVNISFHEYSILITNPC